MLIRLGYEIGLFCPQPVELVCLLDVHPERSHDIQWSRGPEVWPFVATETYADAFGNSNRRFTAPAGRTTLFYDVVIEDSGRPDPVFAFATEDAPQDLPSEVLVYLLGSRYCETDVMMPVAWQLFGHLAPGWSRVQAIFDFVHDHMRFDYGYARSTRTAAEAYNERVGVCRDFAHLALTLCRCMNIPARYVNGYLGDIGVPFNPAPMDFNAWCEVWIGGRWHTFDARHNVPRIGRVVIARGRDATDIPMLHSFGPHQLTKFTVWTEEIADLSGVGDPERRYAS